MVTITEDGYGHSNDYEWTRVWKFRKGDIFGSHAPPVLMHWNPHIQKNEINETEDNDVDVDNKSIIFKRGGWEMIGEGKSIELDINSFNNNTLSNQFNKRREGENISKGTGGRRRNEITTYDWLRTESSACLGPDSTVKLNIGFTHYAYVYEEQVNKQTNVHTIKEI